MPLSKGAALPPSKGAAVKGYQEYLISVQEYFIFVQEYLIFVQVYFIFVQEYLISVQEYLIFVQEYFIFVQEYIFGKFTKDHLADLSRLLGLVSTVSSGDKHFDSQCNGIKPYKCNLFDQLQC